MTRIFYVEDEPFLAKIVKDTLEAKSYQVSHLLDGNKAISSYNGALYDICVLDVMLPGKDGFEIAAAIREMDPAIPILFLTAKNQTEDLVKGFASGGNDYIRKPFSMEELMLRIENLLKLTDRSHKAETLSDEIPLGRSYLFYPNKLELSYNHQAIQLSHRECEIVKELYRHVNNTTDRKALLKNIWGDDSFYNSRNLDVYINKLRAHFKKDPAIQIITLKGVGYKFIVT